MELHVGADVEKTVVSAYRLRTRTGRARRRRTGSLIESRPVLPSGRSREVRVTFLARLSLPMLAGGALLFATGAPAWLLALVIVGLVGTAGWIDRRRAQAGVFEIPREAAARVLRTREERAAFARAVAMSHRV